MEKTEALTMPPSNFRVLYNHNPATSQAGMNIQHVHKLHTEVVFDTLCGLAPTDTTAITHMYSIAIDRKVLRNVKRYEKIRTPA